MAQWWRLLRRVGHLPQIIEGEKSRAVAVAPDRLKSIAADTPETRELKRLRGERPRRAAVNLAHHVSLPAAARAGAALSQRLETDETFHAIVPLDRQLFANLLNVQRMHTLTAG